LCGSGVGVDEYLIISIDELENTVTVEELSILSPEILKLPRNRKSLSSTDQLAITVAIYFPFTMGFLCESIYKIINWKVH
jgi:hypothetical protein